MNKVSHKDDKMVGVAKRAFYNAGEVAKILGVSKAYVYKWVDEIPHRRIGNRILFPIRQLQEWIDNGTDYREV